MTSPISGKGSMVFGGTGGGVKGRDVQLVRMVPKFLQGHMHLLGRKPVVQEEDSDNELDVPAIVEVKNKNEADEDDDNQVDTLFIFKALTRNQTNYTIFPT